MRIDLGVNAFEKPYYAHAGDYILYQEIPGGKGPGFADCANGTRPETFAEQMRVLAANAGNPYWQWYAETAALGKLPAVVSYVAFARASQTPPTARPPVDVPQSKLFRGVGLAAMNKTLTSTPSASGCSSIPASATATRARSTATGCGTRRAATA